MVRRVLPAISILSFFVSSLSHAWPHQFLDPNFDDSDWNLNAYYAGKGGLILTGQNAFGGNPSTYRVVDHFVDEASSGSQSSSIVGFHAMTGATYLPSTAGPITAIDYSMDYLNMDTYLAGHRFALALLQDGKIYRIVGDLSYSGSGWRNTTHRSLKADDFGVQETGPGFGLRQDQHPNFEADGSQIEFGFLTANSNTTTDATMRQIVGYDNWSVCVHTNVMPGEIFFVTPRHEAVDVLLDSYLDWGFFDPNSEYNKAFTVFLTTDPNDLTPIAADLTETIFNPGPLEPLTKYYWAVTLGDVLPTVSDIRSFTTGDAIAVDLDPADGTDGVTATPMLRWTGQGPVDSFDVYFGDDPNIADAGVDSPLYHANLSAQFTAFDPTPDSTILLPGHQYFWRIDQRLEGGEIKQGNTWSFTTIDFICSPPLLGDTNGDCVINMQDFIYLEQHWLECHRVPDIFCP